MLNQPLQAALQKEIERRKLPEDFISTVEKWYLPIAKTIAEQQQRKQNCLLVSFNGAQGSGKSTITAFLQIILIYQYHLNTVELSIDDFYLTRKQRDKLASKIHPLFVTRGVPGTHDVDLAKSTIDCVRHCDQHNSCQLPRFNKATDDRLANDQWLQVNQSVQVILFEGWCNHAPVQSSEELQQPINELERVEDAQGTWRHYVNEQLKIYHRELFNQADLLIYLQVPSFEKVYEWRGLQEKKLAILSAGNDHAVMDEKQLARFIQHYQRITLDCLRELPGKADLVLRLNDNHGIEALIRNKRDAGDE